MTAKELAAIGERVKQLLDLRIVASDMTSAELDRARLHAALVEQLSQRIREKGCAGVRFSTEADAIDALLSQGGGK